MKELENVTKHRGHANIPFHSPHSSDLCRIVIRQSSTDFNQLPSFILLFFGLMNGIRVFFRCSRDLSLQIQYVGCIQGRNRRGEMFESRD